MKKEQKQLSKVLLSPKLLNQTNFVFFTPLLCLFRAVCTVFRTWLTEYPEDFKSLREPSRLLRLAPLLPQDSSSAADLRAQLLRIAEELSEKALLPADAHKGLCFALNKPMLCLKHHTLLFKYYNLETSVFHAVTSTVSSEWKSSLLVGGSAVS